MTQPLVPLSFHRLVYRQPYGSWEFLVAPPPRDLIGIVDSFWISRGRVTFLLEKVLPQNNVELMFNLEQPFGVPNRAPADRSYRRAWIAGMQRDWLIVAPKYDPLREPSYLLSVRMPPLGAYRVLGIPMRELAQDVIELSDTLGDAVHEVHQRLGETAGAGMQLAVLCDFVRRRLALDRVSLHADAQAAIAMLAQSAGTERIENICRSIGVSRKHLRHLFQAHVGLTPKTYARMLRFRRIVDFIQSRPLRLDWARLAMSCGYYDQPHFNREFREFAGMTPEEFAGAGSLDGLTMLIDG